MDQFEPKLSTFKSWKETNYSPGYRCRNSPLIEPSAYNRVENPNISGRFCKTLPEPTVCKVPAHQGPIGNGFKIERTAADAERAPGFVTPELEVKGFKDYTKFANCMMQVMLEIEGIAHHPEMDEKLKNTAGAFDEALWRQEVKDENYDLDGLRNGLSPRSLPSKASNIRNIDSGEYLANEKQGKTSQYLHGGGSRYIQGNNDDYYINGCLKYLDEKALPGAYEVPGNSLPGSHKKTHTLNSVDNTDNAGDGPGSLDFDMDSSLLGYYPQKITKRSDGLCVQIPRWLPEREANFVKYGFVDC